MLLNKTLEIPFPDNFLEMSREEKAGLRMIESGENAVLSDKEKHLLVTVGWKLPGSFFLRILSNQDLKKKMEFDIRKAMEELNYQNTGSLDTLVGGRPASGFSYQYTAADGTEMSGESYVLRRGSILYYFHMYSRRELESENRELMRKILASARWTV